MFYSSAPWQITFTNTVSYFHVQAKLSNNSWAVTESLITETFTINTDAETSNFQFSVFRLCLETQNCEVVQSHFIPQKEIQTTWEDLLNLCMFGPQLALRLSMCRPPAPVGTGVLSWLSWSHRTVAVTTCVRPTTAAARTLISSASGQVLNRHPFLSSNLFISFYVAF